jgi:hypothetical protein
MSENVENMVTSAGIGQAGMTDKAHLGRLLQIAGLMLI